MIIKRQNIIQNGFEIPSILIIPDNSIGSVLIMHGYGGCKEEQLGLAFRIAEKGITACTIDLRGHGEHKQLLDDKILLEVEAALAFCKQFGKCTAMGHSLGGRLALVSSAEYSIGISPALNSIFNEKTIEILKNIRAHRVRESKFGTNFEILKNLAVFDPKIKSRAVIIYGSRDIPDIIKSCNELKESNTPVFEIKDALHSDIFECEETIAIINKTLGEWFR